MSTIDESIYGKEMKRDNIEEPPFIDGLPYYQYQHLKYSIHPVYRKAENASKIPTSDGNKPNILEYMMIKIADNFILISFFVLILAFAGIGFFTKLRLKNQTGLFMFLNCA